MALGWEASKALRTGHLLDLPHRSHSAHDLSLTGPGGPPIFCALAQAPALQERMLGSGAGDLVSASTAFLGSIYGL
jgi:hypothetical protein